MLRAARATSSGAMACKTQAKALRVGRLLHSSQQKQSFSGFARMIAIGGVSAYTLSSADCHASMPVAPMPVISAPIPAPSQVLRQANQSSTIAKTIKKLWNQLCHAYQLCARWLEHMFTFAPVILGAPVLLLQSPEWSNYWWSILRWSLLRSGPCAIKFSQWMATRPDLFPTELCNHLLELQSIDVVPSWEDIEPILIHHYGRDWEQTLQVERGPDGKPVVIGGGCVAQVLRAKVYIPENSAGSEVDDVDHGIDRSLSVIDRLFSQPERMEWKKRDAAIKITHPGVRHSITLDLELMTMLSSLAETCIPPLRQVSITDSVQEFSKSMLQQVDMNFEARNLQKLIDNFSAIHMEELEEETSKKKKKKPRSNFDDDEEEDLYHKNIYEDLGAELHELSSAMRLADAMRGKLLDMFVLRKGVHHGIHFPRPFLKYTNEDVLVEEYEPGELIRDHIQHCSDAKKKKIARIGMDAIFKMVFIDNFVHADLHPGNIIITHPESSDVELSLIDAGLVVSLEPEDRKNLIDLFKAVITNDGIFVGQMMIDRSRDPRTVINGPEFCEGIKAIVDVIHKSGLSLGSIGISEILNKVLVLCYKHQVKLESRFASVMVAMGIVEGLGRQLDPDIDILQRCAPYVMRAAIMIQSGVGTIKRSSTNSRYIKDTKETYY